MPWCRRLAGRTSTSRRSSRDDLSCPPLVTSVVIDPPPDLDVVPVLHLSIVAAGDVVTIAFSGPQADVLRRCVHEATRVWAACDPAPVDADVAHADARCLLGYAVGAGDSTLAIRSALTQLSRDVTRVIVQRRERSHVLLHSAGVLSPGDGRCVVLVGPSGAGKTTFARTFERNGYLTDELVLVDSGGAVLPYPKPFSVVTVDRVKDERAPTWSVRTPRDLGALIILERVDEPTDPTVTRLDLAESLASLVPHTSRLSSLSDPLSHLGGLIGRCGGAVRLRYSEAADVDLDELLSHCDEKDIRFTRAGDDPCRRRSHGDALVRAPYADAIETRGAVIILRDDELFQLSAAAAAVWRCCVTAAAADDIATATGLARAQVRQLADRLVGLDVLRRT